MVHGSAQPARKSVRSAAPEVAQPPLELAGVAPERRCLRPRPDPPPRPRDDHPPRLAPGRPEHGRPVARYAGGGVFGLNGRAKSPQTQLKLRLATSFQPIT